MNISTADDHFAFSLGELTYIDSTYDGESTDSIAKARKHGVARWFGRLLEHAAEWRRRRATMQEMAMMSDRELSDIGLSRADLGRVFDPAFAATRARDYIAY